MIPINQFLEAPVAFLSAALESNVISRATLVAARQMLIEIPIQAAYCPCCADQFDAASGEVAPPTVVRLRSCGHWCCDRCVRHCSHTECAQDGCSDCMALCEGHAEPQCRDHIVAKNYCEECTPRGVVHEFRRPAYCYEDD